MRNLIVFLMLAAMASGAFDQSYVQTVASDGSSVIAKTQDISPFSSIVSIPALGKACQMLSSVQCAVQGQDMTITERFPASNGYYTLMQEDGFPYIIYMLIITKIPNDVFSADVERVMAAANASSGGAAAPAIDISADNSAAVAVLRSLNVNVIYTVEMPVQPFESSGTIEGDSVTFNVVDVMDAKAPMVVKARQLNVGMLVLILGIMVIAGLAYSFFGMSRKTGKPSPSLKRKKAK